VIETETPNNATPLIYSLFVNCKVVI